MGREDEAACTTTECRGGSGHLPHHAPSRSRCTTSQYPRLVHLQAASTGGGWERRGQGHGAGWGRAAGAGEGVVSRKPCETPDTPPQHHSRPQLQRHWSALALPALSHTSHTRTRARAVPLSARSPSSPLPPLLLQNQAQDASVTHRCSAFCPRPGGASDGHTRGAGTVSWGQARGHISQSRFKGRGMVKEGGRERGTI